MPGHLEKTNGYRRQKRKGLDGLEEQSTYSPIHMYIQGQYVLQTNDLKDPPPLLFSPSSHYQMTKVTSISVQRSSESS